ncbi:MAG: hypothetical protein GY816_13190 [Cytophagales bacterium]|nr:hypothetical protein [Cytophagales bacterium]
MFELTNSAATDGVNLFLYIAIGLIAFVSALMYVNARKEKAKKNID